jgi:hypothetical protein
MDIRFVGATIISVGLSSIVSVRAGAYLQATNLKILSGGGTLELVPPPIALSGASAIGWGRGYPIGANESIHIDGPSKYYLAATGATMRLAALIGYSAGASLGV